jgi:hypothetical protein
MSRPSRPTFRFYIPSWEDRLIPGGLPDYP